MKRRLRNLTFPIALALAIVLTMASPPHAGAAETVASRFETVNPAQAIPPALSLIDTAGQSQDLARYRGRLVVLNFWASWCAPCLDELPALQDLKVRMAGKPVTVLAVNFGESTAKAAAFAQRAGVDYPVLVDAFQLAQHDWKVRSLPTTFLIGPDGRVVRVVHGELDWGDEAVLDHVRALLPKP